MRLEYLVMVAAGLLLLLLLWPRGEEGAPAGPLLPPLAEIEIEGESVRRWSVDLTLKQGLSPLAREVRPRILLAWAALTAAAYPAGSPELAAAAQTTHPRILVAWAATSTSILPRASGDLASETSKAQPRILVEWAALTASLYPQGPSDHAANPAPRVEVQGAALSTLIQDIEPSPQLTEETSGATPRIVLEAAPLGEMEELGPSPGLPGEGE